MEIAFAECPLRPVELHEPGGVGEHGRHDTPELAVLRFSVLEEGELRRREEATALLSASLAEVGRGQEQRLLIERGDGLRLPTVLSASDWSRRRARTPTVPCR